MLQTLDLLLTLTHFLIIGFNLFGWIAPATRKWHFYLVLATAASWFLLGIWFGMGYCPITDWQWQVKRKLGETNLPSSFIKYYADKISGRDIDADLVNNVTLIVFLLIIAITIILKIRDSRRQRR